MNERIQESDRELLEAAAKAAGMDIEWQPCGWAHNNETGCEWNPLTDDGDAFRLMVRCLPFYTVCYSREDYEACNRDGLAATRRAIVRAAAEIGKDMK
jgi:hypothetical protein